MKSISTILLTCIVLTSVGCSMSKKAKTLLTSTGVGCALGLAAGAIYDETQRKKDTQQRKKLQNQISSMFKSKKAQNKGKVVGLAAGCLAGLGTGFYLNTMYDDMNDTLGKSGIGLEKVPGADGETGALLVKMDGGVTFEDGKSDLKGQGKTNINKLAEALGAYPETNIKVSGHANRTGSDDVNRRLSQNRAEAAKDALEEEGIEGKRIIEAKGFSSEKPLPGKPATDGSNRRVEVEIVGA